MSIIENKAANLRASDVADLAIKKRRKRKEFTIKALLHAVLITMGISMVIPLLWMVSTSLKQPVAVFDFPPQWIPRPIVWENYVTAWKSMPFARFYFNSLFVGTVVTVGQVLTSAMAAYAFARLNFPFRDKLFFGYLATMMIPGSVTMIPVFILFKLLGLVDTYSALILPGFFSAYGTFMLRQFFMSIPKELEEAAKLDGCSLWGIFINVILPLSKPGLATLTTFTFMGSWGNFMWPMIVTNSEEIKTLPIGLLSFQGMYNTDWTLLMAGSLIVLIPVIIVFLLGQRHFVEGIQMGAIKG